MNEASSDLHPLAMESKCDELTRTFRRSRQQRTLAGVCGGLADLLKVDVTLIRIGVVLLTVFGVGAGVVLYLAAWVLAPEANAELTSSETVQRISDADSMN